MVVVVVSTNDKSHIPIERRSRSHPMTAEARAGEASSGVLSIGAHGPFLWLSAEVCHSRMGVAALRPCCVVFCGGDPSPCHDALSKR